ncbi:hypothetical protein AURDEDRAFT_166726 [Auricularia subglabra TFB-10046 SS5]|nr:hypothetical protein AURDEDRAFT_166726 [Auricularia subglabra TFB-10046 SS5]
MQSLFNLFAQRWFGKHARGPGETADNYNRRMLAEFRVRTAGMGRNDKELFRRALLARPRARSLWNVFLEVWYLCEGWFDDESVAEYRDRAARAFGEEALGLRGQERRAFYRALEEELALA